jgi:hypothetical protein
MRLVVVLLLALLIAPLAAPIARAVASPGADHSCCPEPPSQTRSTAPCQYLAPLGCCEQVSAPPSVSADAPSARLFAAAAAPPAPSPAPASVSRAGLRRDHGPPEAPFLRAIVLQL